jgi:hypothetical protein
MIVQFFLFLMNAIAQFQSAVVVRTTPLCSAKSGQEWGQNRDTAS